MTLVVTGANGFIGSAVVRRAHNAGIEVRALTRANGNIASDTDFSPFINAGDIVVHTAGRAHVMRDMASDPLAEYRRVNVEGSVHLACQAARSGAKRFIFLSSIKVNGDETHERPFHPDDLPAPTDAYGLSKAEAEMALGDICAASGMGLSIIRPVLVYGPGVRGNFRSMMRLLARKVPLPLGAIENRRSLVSLDNLVDLIFTTTDSNASRQILLVSDGEDLSTPDLLRRTASALGKRAILVPVPQRFMKASLELAGKKDVATRLLGSLQVDISVTREQVGWTPRYSMDESLRKTAAYFSQFEGIS